MYNLINLVTWVLSITAFISILGINKDLFFLALVVAGFIKIILNKTYIENSIKSLKEEIKTDIIEKISRIGLKTKDLSKIKETLDSEINNENITNNDLKSVVINEVDIKSELDEVDSDDDISKQDAFGSTSLKNEEINELEEEIVDDEDDDIPEAPSEPSKIGLFFKEFFAENLMAKIGGILLALGAIFFMSLIYAVVGPVAKIVIGFLVGFSIYGIGNKMYSKGSESEAMILFGTGILINYIVILSGKFIIGDGIDNGFLSSSLTFLLLILNTLFSVVTAFIYKSKNLLLFSIIFAYVIPFLTGGDYLSYVLVGYSLILSLGGFAISNYFHDNKDDSSSLQMVFISLVGGNILILLAVLGNSAEFAVKMIGFNIINFLSIYLLYRNKFEKNISSSFIISYVFLAFLMISGSSLTGFPILISFVIAVLGLLVINSYLLIISVGIGLVYLIFLPVFFVLGFIFIGGAGTGIILLPLFLLSYLAIFSIGVGGILSTGFKYVFFTVIGFFLIIGNSYMLANLGIDNLGIDNYTFGSIIITSFIFLFSNYLLSNKKDLHYLYSVGTLVTIFLLGPVLQIKGDFMNLSILTIVIFGISNYLLPFINSNLIKNDSQNMVLGSVLGIIFLGINLFIYGNLYFPGVTLGLGFLVLAILYFIGGFILFSKIEPNKSEKSESDLNFIYAFLGIAISLFSIAVALVFAKMPAIVAMIWLFQSSIVFFFANKLNSKKIYIAGIILFMIGLAKYGYYFSYLVNDLLLQMRQTSPESIINNGGFKLTDYVSHLVGNLFIGISIFLNIIIFRKTKFNNTNGVNILHIMGVILLGLNIVYLFTDYIAKYIITGNNSGIPNILIGCIILALSIIYNLIGNKYTKSFLVFFTSLVLGAHIFSASSVINYGLNYVFTIIIGIVYLIDKMALDNGKITNFKSHVNSFGTIFGIYSFIITSIYLFHSTHNYFSLTIYWGLLSVLFVHIGIFKLNKTLRGIGLYLLIITLLKIAFYDIWNNIDDPLVRVIAFMFVGGIMIYFSSLYKKKRLVIKDDLSIFPDIVDNIDNKNEKQVEKIIPERQKDNQKSKSIVNNDLDKIDLGGKQSITFMFDDGKKIKIRAKNLVKIGMIVIEQAKKTVFKKGELIETYNFIRSNYKSELTKKDYDKIIEIIESFIQTGGKIVIE